MKYIIGVFSFFTLVLCAAPYAFAQTASVSPVATGVPARVSARITALQTRGDQLISDRLNALTTINNRLGNMQRLSLPGKKALTINVTNAINGLTALRAKIDADTDIVTLQDDVKSIYTTYRVYAEFDPQTSLLAASDTLSTVTDQLTDLATKLQTRINQASASGADVSIMSSSLSDMQSSIQSAKDKYTTVESDIAGLSPSAYNSDPTGVHSTFVNSRDLLKTARASEQTAFDDAKKIIAILKTIKPSVSPTSSAATTSATPSS